MNRVRTGLILFPSLALLMASGILMQRLSFAAEVEDAASYHAKVRKAVEAMPAELGDWTGERIDIPNAAVALLKPNAILGRRYENQVTGQRVDVLVVHCRDARDMAGHYPPVCYPSSGWTEDGSNVMDRGTDREAPTWARYDFSRVASGYEVTMTVLNVLVLPDGRMVHTMAAVRDQAADYRSHFLGAGQIQFVFQGRPSEARCESIVSELMLAVNPVIDAITQREE